MKQILIAALISVMLSCCHTSSQGHHSEECSCPPLHTFPNHHINRLTFNGDDCQQTVQCTKANPRGANIYLGFLNSGRTPYKTQSFPTFAHEQVFCQHGLWTIRGSVFDSFDC